MPTLLRLIALQIVALPLCFLIGKAAFYWGVGIPGFEEVGVLLLKGLFFYAALHVLLVWPLYQFARRDISQVKDQNLQTLIYFVLVFLPLSAFTYLTGNIRSWVDFAELLLATVPPTLIGAYIFTRNQKPYLFSLLLAVPLFLSLFVISDIMGPFKTRTQFLSDGNYVLVLRLFLAVTAIAVAAFKFRKREDFTPGDALIALGVSVPLFHAVAPFLQKSMGVQDLQLLSLSEIAWVGLIAVGILNRIPSRSAELWSRIWGLGLVGYSLFALTQKIHYEDLQFKDLHAVILYYGSVIFLSALVFAPPLKRGSRSNAISQQVAVTPY